MSETTKIFDNYPDIVSIADLQDMLKVGRVLAYKLIKDKKVTAQKIGRDYKITKSSVVALVEGGDEN